MPDSKQMFGKSSGDTADFFYLKWDNDSFSLFYYVKLSEICFITYFYRYLVMNKSFEEKCNVKVVHVVWVKYKMICYKLIIYMELWN